MKEKISNLFTLMALATCVFGLPFQALSASTNVVDVFPGDFQHKIGNNLSGANIIESWEPDSNWSNGCIESNLADMGTSFIRYPGGEETDYFHWEAPSGVYEKDSWSPTWNTNNNASPTNWMSVDEYMGHVDVTGAQPLLGINMDSGYVYPDRLSEAVAEAANFVNYALTNGYAVKYWFIGNEPYISNRGQMSVTQYADYINLYANAMRAVDPQIKIIVNWNASWSSSAYGTLLSSAGTNIDMLDLHCYWNFNNGTWANWINQLPMQFSSSTYEDNFKTFRSNLDSLGYTNIQIGMLEYNVGPDTNNSPPSLYQVGLMDSEILLQSVEGGLDAGCFFVMDRLASKAANQPTELFNSNTNFTPRPAFYPLKWFGAVAGQTSVKSSQSWARTFTTAALNPTENILTTFILRKANSSALIELNSHGFGAQTVKIETFQAADGDITNDESEIITQSYTNLSNGNIQFTVPPWSLTRIILTKPTCHIETGSVTTNGVNGSTWRTVTFANAFPFPPVVICSPLTANASEPAMVSVRNIATNGFQYRIAEWNYQDQTHSNEAFQWVAAPAGVYDINGQTWEAGVTSAAGEWFKANRLKHKNAKPPYFFYQVYQTGISAVSPRVRNVTTNRFEVRLAEELTNTIPAPLQQVGYLAVPWNVNGTLPDGRKFVSLATGNIVDNNWASKIFNTAFTNAAFIAAMQGSVEDDYGCTLRYTNFTSTAVQLKVDEENSTSTNSFAHAKENVSVLVIGNEPMAPFTATSVSPSDQQLLATNGAITVHFSVNLVPGSETNFAVWSKGYPGLYIGRDYQKIAGNWLVTSNQASFTPAMPFTPGDLVVLSIAPQLRSVDGQAFGTNSIYSFLVDDGRRFGARETIINPYKIAGSNSIPIWICAPTNGGGLYPVLFWVHGGGWQDGTPTNSSLSKFDPYICEHLGVVLVGVSYRCLGSSGTFAQGLQDVLDAVSYLNTNALSYHADTNRIGFIAGSAGTPLASLAAQQLPAAKCYIGYNGIYDFVTNPGSIFPGGTSYQQNVPSLTANSAIYNLRSNPPAVLLMHGTADTTISNSQSVLFGAAVAAKHSYAKVCLYQDQPHAFFNDPPMDLITLYEVKEHVRKFLLTDTQTNVWAGGQADNSWDYQTPNWFNDSDPSAYSDGSAVIFDNTGATNSIVNLPTTVQPASVLVNSSSNYTFTGSGKISGAGALVKTGNGTLFMAAVNNYTGGTTISNGAISITADGGLGAAPGTATPGNLVLDGGTLSVASAGGMTINANRGALLGQGGGTLSKVNAGRLTYAGILTGAGTLTVNLAASGGEFAPGTANTFTGGTTFLGDANATVVVGSSVGAPGSLTRGPLGIGTVTMNGPSIRSGNGSASSLGNAFNLAADMIFPTVTSEKSLTMSGPVTLVGGDRRLTVHIGETVGTEKLTLSGAIGDGGNGYGIIKAGAGELVLCGTNTYSGKTTVTEGTLALLSPTAATSLVSNTPNIAVNAGATFDVSDIASGFRLLSGQKLSGSGFIAGSVLVANGAIVAPGPLPAKLTFSNSPTLQGVLLLEINRTNTPLNCDQLAVVGQPLTLGGILIVTNTGPALQLNDNFVLLNASGFSGSFTSMNLPPLSSGLKWNTAALAASGIISVTNSPPMGSLVMAPTFFSSALAGNKLILTGTGGRPGAQYHVLRTTNITLPRSQWTVLATNFFDSGGGFACTNTINPAKAGEFFLLQAP